MESVSSPEFQPRTRRDQRPALQPLRKSALSAYERHSAARRDDERAQPAAPLHTSSILRQSRMTPEEMLADAERHSKSIQPNLHSGHIQVILGPMFSGKSTELLRRLRRYGHARKRTMLIKYRKDTRYEEDDTAAHVITHDRVVIPARPCDKLAELSDEDDFNFDNIDCIGIDEGQFFPDVVEFCERMANAGKIVIVAALDGTFQRKPFGRIVELIPLAETVSKLSAVCMICGKDAAFTQRLGNEDEVELIGGADKYMAVCRGCYMELHSENDSRASLDRSSDSGSASSFSAPTSPE